MKLLVEYMDILQNVSNKPKIQNLRSASLAIADADGILSSSYGSISKHKVRVVIL